MTSIGDREGLLTRFLWSGSGILQCFILAFILVVLFSLSTTLVCSDDVVVNTFVKFLHSVVSDAEMSGNTQSREDFIFAWSSAGVQS